MVEVLGRRCLQGLLRKDLKNWKGALGSFTVWCLYDLEIRDIVIDVSYISPSTWPANHFPLPAWR